MNINQKKQSAAGPVNYGCRVPEVCTCHASPLRLRYENTFGE
jgi:hypothetical protein